MKILNDRNITSSQKGFENVAEGTKYDDYHIDTKGQGILSVENIIDEIEGRGNQAVLTIQTSDGATNHSQFTSESWNEYKDSVNDGGRGASITDVWVTEVEGGSYVRNSRKPIKSAKNGLLAVSSDGRYTLELVNTTLATYCNLWKDGDIAIKDGMLLNEEWGIRNIRDAIRDYNLIVNPAYENIFPEALKSSCRPCNSVRKPGRITELRKEWKDNYRNLFGDDYEFDYFNDRDEALRRDDILRKDETANRIRKEFRSLKDDNWDEFRTGNITSARYIATDPESGEVLGSADSYEEAVNEWGEDVTITDSESQEGQEEMGSIFQSRRPVNSGMQHKDISNVSPDSWRDGSELPEKNFSNMSIEVFNQDGDEVFYDFEARQWYYYPTHKKALVKKWVEKKLVNSSRKITSANNYGWVVDSSEAMDALDLFVEYVGEDTALEGLARALGDNELKENLEWICRQWGFLEEIEDLDTWEQYETAKEYMGVSELLTNLSQAMGYDELSECLAFIFRMYDFREWKSKYDEDEEDYDEEEYSDFEEKEDITSNRSFPVKTVKNILSGKWSEDYAAECIAQKQDINVGYAKQVLSSWIEEYKSKLIKSGILDIAEDINTEFDIDGDLESWAEQYTNDSGKANTVGGEMVRAAMQIIGRYNNDGDMVGRGYGNESVNPAARYIIEKAEMGVNEQIQAWLNHDERADDYSYEQFLDKFTSEIEQILRENPELFQKPNKDDYWSYKVDDDLNYGFDECYLDDGLGNQYWFQPNGGDMWNCTAIELDPYSVTYSEGDTIFDGDEYSDEIDRTEEFGSFEADGFIYEYAGNDWDDDLEQYTSWQITSVMPQDPYCNVGDNFNYYDLEPDSLNGFTLFDHNGNEIDERTFLANSLIKSRFGAGSECVIEIDRHKNNNWEMVAESDDERGWTLKGTAKLFADKNEAKNSDLMKALERSGYSVNKGNLKISEA